MNNIINDIFDLCVKFLVWLSNLFGITYKAINVIIFCIMWPLITLWLIIYVIKLRKKIKSNR